MLGDLLEKTRRFVHSPFISVLLWYDRQISELDHAWLLDTTIQWFFHKSRIRGYAPERGSYVELVIAGSKRELPMSRDGDPRDRRWRNWNGSFRRAREGRSC